MKIQHLCVIFIIIIMPITIVLTATLQARISTLTLQNEYTTKLTDATYDSIKAFQINTVNNRYSTISDSKIRDIEAAINTFFNTLGASQNLSKEDLQNYVPALVFNLYDGYYIYSRYDNVYPKDDGTILNEEDAAVNDGLKPYVFYTCRYKINGHQYIVNYTLDNAITVFGLVKEGNNGKKEYGTISGYLINPGDISDINYDANSPLNSSLKYKGIVIKPEILTEHIVYLADDDTTYISGDYDYVVLNNQKYYLDASNGRYFRYSSTYKKSYILEEDQYMTYLQNRTKNGHLYSTTAVEYYRDAFQFSNQVKDLLGTVTQENAIDESGNKIDFSINTGNSPIFKFNDTDNDTDNDPMLASSTFNQNRIAVIRQSIETNLKAAIANYKEYSSNAYTYQLPVLKDTDWEKITNNVSLTSFMQGLPIGYKFFNDYCVISNDNNEENIQKDSIYIITVKEGQREYHYPGCEKLLGDKNYKIEQAYSNLSFLKQRVRVDEGNYYHFHPQSRQSGSSITPITACYYCIVNASNVYPADDIIKGKIMGKDSNWNDADITTQFENLKGVRECYLHALAREKWHLYQYNMDSFNDN